MTTQHTRSPRSQKPSNLLGSRHHLNRVRRACRSSHRNRATALLTVRGVEYPSTTTTSASRKKTKKDNKPSHGRRRSRKVKRGKAKEKSSARHHVRDGQIVTVSSEPEPGPESPATPSASQPEEADSPARTPHHKGQENRATKTPLSSSPKNSYHASSRRVTSSPTKEDVWNTISRGTGIWPELPRVFSQWDVQVTFLTSPSPGLSQRFSCCCRPVYPM